jgi:hypothetical protein
MVCGYGDQVAYRRTRAIHRQGDARQVVALHRLDAAAAVRRADRLRHRRRDASAADLPFSSRQAGTHRAAALARRRNGDADLARDLCAGAGEGVGALPPPRPQAARSRRADGDLRLARARGAEPRRAALAHPQGRRDDREWRWPRPKRSRRSAICAPFRAAWSVRRRGRKFSPRSSAASRAIPKTLPRIERERRGNGGGATVELLKVLLRQVSERHGVAARMIATDRGSRGHRAERRRRHAGAERLATRPLRRQGARAETRPLALTVENGKVVTLEWQDAPGSETAA